MKFGKLFSILALAGVLFGGSSLTWAQDKKGDDKKTDDKKVEKKADKVKAGYDTSAEGAIKRFKDAIAKKKIYTMLTMIDPKGMAKMSQMTRDMVKYGKVIDQLKMELDKHYKPVQVFRSDRGMFMYFTMLGSLSRMGKMFEMQQKGMADHPDFKDTKTKFLPTEKKKEKDGSVYYVLKFEDDDMRTGQKRIETIHLIKVGKYWRARPIKNGKRENYSMWQDGEMEKMYQMTQHAAKLQEPFQKIIAVIQKKDRPSAHEVGVMIIKVLKKTRPELAGKKKGGQKGDEKKGDEKGDKDGGKK